MKKLFKNFESGAGFTIIELAISIFILSFAVVGVFSVFSMIVILTSDASDRLTATYLTQEGMEIVRNIRDTNWLNMDICASGGTPNAVSCPVSWADGLDCASGCEADYTTGTGVSGARSMSPWASLPLCIDTNGFYYYTSS